MIQKTSELAYMEILEVLPDKTRPVYEVIFYNPRVCIGEIGRILKMQNSSVSGRVNDLIDSKLVHYIENPGWICEAERYEKKPSPISGKSVMMLRANDIFKVDTHLIRLRQPRRKTENNEGNRPQGSVGAESYKVQKDFFS